MEDGSLHWGGKIGWEPPSHAAIFPNPSNSHFLIFILFNVIERSVNYVFKEDAPRTLRARVVSYALEANKVYLKRVMV